MKILRITESQYKRLVRGKNLLTEQLISYNDEKDEKDVHKEMVEVLEHIGLRIFNYFNKPLYILKIEGGVVHIDKSKYTSEELEFVKRFVEQTVSDSTYSTKDKLLSNTGDLGFDSGYDSDYDWGDEDITVVEPDDDTTEVEDDDVAEVEDNDDVVNPEDVEDNDDVAEVDDVDLDYDPNKTYTRTEYINLVKDIAIDQMKRYKIPASITIAQGIIESADRYGVPANSWLAKKAKNHFGVKCHGWSGEEIYLDTGEQEKDGTKYTVNDCFRKYDYIKDSFEDHSKFLLNNPKYNSLFDLDITDYKGWAEGLKKAGYATNINYDKLLINIIEKNNLQQYDGGDSTITDCEKCLDNRTQKEISDYANNINDKNVIDFRWWVNQNSGILDKVIDKFKECCETKSSLTLDINNKLNDWTVVAFLAVGNEWINTNPKPKKPKLIYKDKNGNLDSNQLTKVITGHLLSKAAASKFDEMYKAAEEDGVTLKLSGPSSAYRLCGGPGDYTRNLSNGQFTQWYAWESYKFGSGNKASRPVPPTEAEWIKQGGGRCKSNHGWGNAIDVSGRKAQKWVTKNGKKYGWLWGEEPSEKHHFTYCGEDAENRSGFCPKI